MRAPSHRELLENTGGVILASPPPTNSARPHGGPYGSEATFDTNMVIILAALLCALICALGLNSIIRCALRCTGRLVVSNHMPPNREAGGGHVVVGCHGLKRSTLRKIPVAIYEKSPTGIGNNNNNVISTDCIICLGEFIDGEKIRVLPKCKHGFHVRCVDVWLLSHSSCPTCRQPVSEWAGNGVDVGADVGRDTFENGFENENGNGNTQREATSYNMV